jgi:hypothetical protein
MAAAAGPMPAECNWSFTAINLRFDLTEGEGGIGRLIGRKMAFLVFRPTAVITASGIIHAARREPETVIGTIA